MKIWSPNLTKPSLTPYSLTPNPSPKGEGSDYIQGVLG